MMTEKEELENEIERLKKNLSDYLKISSLLDVSEKEKERVTNRFLDDILNRKNKLRKYK
jgi:hypothetical protein